MVSQWAPAAGVDHKQPIMTLLTNTTEKAAVQVDSNKIGIKKVTTQLSKVEASCAAPPNKLPRVSLGLEPNLKFWSGNIKVRFRKDFWTRILNMRLQIISVSIHCLCHYARSSIHPMDKKSKEPLQHIKSVWNSIAEKLWWFIRQLSEGPYIFYWNLWNISSDIWL